MSYAIQPGGGGKWWLSEEITTIDITSSNVSNETTLAESVVEADTVVQWLGDEAVSSPATGASRHRCLVRLDPANPTTKIQGERGAGGETTTTRVSVKQIDRSVIKSIQQVETTTNANPKDVTIAAVTDKDNCDVIPAGGFAGSNHWYDMTASWYLTSNTNLRITNKNAPGYTVGVWILEYIR